MPSHPRKSTYKVPPTTITDTFLSQDHRRTRMLEEQKRRRASRIEEARFANMSLGPSDDEDSSAEQIVHEGISNFASMLEVSSTGPVCTTSLSEPHTPIPRNNKRKAKPDHVHQTTIGHPKPSKWADQCMYAELLEMPHDDPYDLNCGLPDDLETGWLAIAPVPVGKRCLAVVHASTMPGQPNTSLRSRVLGKPLMAMFPSFIPQNSVLDCILDQDWKRTGILHILDIIKWKGQDLGDCEATMRFWYRDTRLAELPHLYPPAVRSGGDTSETYVYPYPTNMRPIPYHTDTSLSHLSTHIIPLAKTHQSLRVEGPGSLRSDPPVLMDMDVESVVEVTINSDGLLLYVAEASYECGTSPLSSWIPLTSHSPHFEHTQSEDLQSPIDRFQSLVLTRLNRVQVGPHMDIDIK